MPTRAGDARRRDRAAREGLAPGGGDESNWRGLMADNSTQPHPIHRGVRTGHVHLKVADLERAIAFYRDVLGFELMQRFGRQAAFLSAGGYHHHLGLNTWESLGGSPPSQGTTGLYHLAILYPTRAELADGLRRLIRAGVELDGAADHGVSEALYLRDLDGNGVELYWRSEEHTSELQSRQYLVCRLLLE